MKLKKGRLIVFYNLSKGRLNSELDKAIRDLIEKEFGYESIGSGFDLTDGTRDLAFEEKK